MKLRGKIFHNDKVDMLVGLDLYWNFVYNDGSRGTSEPVALNSRLFWLLSGPLYTPDAKQSSREWSCGMFIDAKETDSLDSLVEKYWSLESVSVEERETDVMARFLEFLWFNPESSRYCVSLPWWKGVGILADKYEISLKLQLNLVERFRRELEFSSPSLKIP